MRPTITCHMVTSIDGRLHPSRWTTVRDEGNTDLISKRYEALAKELGGQGFILGRTTLAEFDGITSEIPAPSRSGAAPRPPHQAHGADEPVAVVIDPQGKLRYTKHAIDGGHRILTCLAETVSDDYLTALKDAGISYTFAGNDGADLARAMDTLGDTFGLEALLLEGGGTINGAFLHAALIDEISVLLYPGVDGLAGVASIFDHRGEPDSRPAQGQRLSLISAQPLDDGFVWLRYRVQHP